MVDERGLNAKTRLFCILAHVQNPVLRIESKYVPLCVEPKVHAYVNRTLQGDGKPDASSDATGLL